jgi:hypothetical protein
MVSPIKKHLSNAGSVARVPATVKLTKADHLFFAGIRHETGAGNKMGRQARTGPGAADGGGTTVPAAELESFIGKYNADMAAQIREVLASMRAKLPAANQLVYDNYNALAIGFASGERVTDVIFSIACYPRWISLFFFPGAGFDDPGKLLKGAGKKCRHIVLRGPETLDDPDVSALMRQALKSSGRALDKGPAGRLIIKSVSAKQRPRRPPPD